MALVRRTLIGAGFAAALTLGMSTAAYAGSGSVTPSPAMPGDSVTVKASCNVHQGSITDINTGGAIAPMSTTSEMTLSNGVQATVLSSAAPGTYTWTGRCVSAINIEFDTISFTYTIAAKPGSTPSGAPNTGGGGSRPTGTTTGLALLGAAAASAAGLAVARRRRKA